MSRDLAGLFTPKSIAVVGASQIPQKVGAMALKNIIVSGYSGRVYPVNPNLDNIGSLKFYPNVASLPEVPDLAVIAIPAAAVMAELEECGQTGIKNVVIFSSGFKEIGEKGEELEKQLVAVAAKYQLNILGPNCLGFALTNPSLNATFGQVTRNQGSLKFITQSGALATSLFDWCQATGLGFDNFVTIGNKAVINENDILEYWLPQLSQPTEELKPVGLYLESISAGSAFVRMISQITPYNPVFILKPGKSPSAAAAMRSHTGSIAGEDRVFEEAMRQVGVIRCQELGDFFDMAQAFAWKNGPGGPKVAVLSNAGGPAVLTTDSIADMGLEMARLSKTTQDKLHQCLPPTASVANPVDVLGDALAVRFGQALEVILEDESVDSVVVLLTPQMMTQIKETASVIGQLAAKYTKPIFCSFIGGSQTIEGQKILNGYKVPNYLFPEKAIKVIAAMWRWQKWRLNRPLPRKPEGLSFEDSRILSALNSRDNDELMSAISIPVPPAKVITTFDEAVAFSNENGWPVVLKLLSPELLHKSDIGGVKLNIRSAAELAESFNQLAQKITDKIRIQIQKQIEGGIEVILGIKRDPSFGDVLLFGAGGKYAEILDDHILRLIPLSAEDAKTTVNQSKVFKLLNGYRDDPAYDLNQLYEIMIRLSQLMISCPQIGEIEINPVIVTHQGTWAVDPKVILKTN